MTTPNRIALKPSWFCDSRQALTDNELWTIAFSIFSEHNELTADYIIDQLRMEGVLCDHVLVEDWRRITVAVGVIIDAKLQ
jgi:hypothetical protein